MSALLTLAQAAPAANTGDSSSAAAAVFGVVALVGVFSIVAITSKGRRTLMPLVAVALGVSLGVTSFNQSHLYGYFGALSVIGLFFAVVMVIGGLGALRESAGVPEVEGIEPEIHPVTPSSDDN